MTTPFLGEIRLVAFSRVPNGWAACDGQILPINQNQALFALLGTSFGGNGQTTFALPDLRGRTPRHTGAGVVLGEMAGEAAHTLNQNEMPAHVHELPARSGAAIDTVPGGSAIAAGPRETFARNGSPLVPMQGGRVAGSGGNQPHENRQPYATLQYIIAMQGVFPSPNSSASDVPFPFIGEVRMFAGNFAPQGFLFCDGQLLPITTNTALFSLVGVMYGGNATTNFALPDLRGRVPVHRGPNDVQGARAGVETVTLTSSQIPNHGHELVATSAQATDTDPHGNVPARAPGEAYAPASGLLANPVQTTPAGGAQPHDNMAPSLPIRFILATDGIYPSWS
jgi:microcystin-dependent protein